MTAGLTETEISASPTPGQKSLGIPNSGALAFPGAGRKRDRALSRAARERRAQAEETARTLLAGGLTDGEVYADRDPDTMLDLATCGLISEYLGRPRCRWGGFADQAHIRKTQTGREYAAFCDDLGITNAVQVVVRSPVSEIALKDLRAVHSCESARLADRLRYGRTHHAPDFACDLVSTEVRSIAEHASRLDLHFHLTVRASRTDLAAMQAYFRHGGWSWWDSLIDESQGATCHPRALAQYSSKGLAATVRAAAEEGFAFSPENLAEFRRQTHGLAMTRKTGVFRAWMSDIDRRGLVIAEDDNGRSIIRPRRRVPTASRLRERLFTGTGARLLRLTLHDFGDGQLRPSARVRGRQGISFAEIADTYDLGPAVSAARHALLCKDTTSTPESDRSPETASLPPPRPPNPLSSRQPVILPVSRYHRTSSLRLSELPDALRITPRWTVGTDHWGGRIIVPPSAAEIAADLAQAEADGQIPW